MISGRLEKDANESGQDELKVLSCSAIIELRSLGNLAVSAGHGQCSFAEVVFETAEEEIRTLNERVTNQMIPG